MSETSMSQSTDHVPTMRAVIHTQSAQSLAFDSKHAIPQPGPQEYLVKVLTTAITTGELLWPRPPHLDTSHPGVEMSGIIVSAPSSLSNPRFRRGDKVYMRTTHPRAGSAREYTTALDSELALRPVNLSSVEAAAVPVAGLTAWQGLFDHAKLALKSPASPANAANPAPRILVNGASSATGLFFVQLARLAGVPSVTGVCSAKNAPLVREMGATQVVDYHTTALTAQAYDIIFDCVRPTTSLWQALAPQGRLYTIAPAFDITRVEEWKWDLDPPAGCAPGVSGKFYIMEAKGDDLAKVTELIEEGRVKVVVDSVWELEEYEQAFQRLGSGRAVGKVVLKIAEEAE